MEDVMTLPGRPDSKIDSWGCWDEILGEPSQLDEDSRAGTVTRSACRADVTSVRSLSRCHSSDAGDALYLGYGSAQHNQQKHLHQKPLLHGAYEELAKDCSRASSQSNDSLLSLMLGGLPSGSCSPGSLTTSAELPSMLGIGLHESSQAACAEQPSWGSERLCWEASPEPAPPMLDDAFAQAASSDSSADWLGSAHGLPHGLEASPLQQAAHIPNRKRGRPRRYDTTLPLGTMDAHVAAGAAMVNGEQPGVRKRGAKPKYRFITAEEAVAHRRERNRSTAIATHERKKAREAALRAELTLRQGEHDALRRLLEYVQQPKADKEMVRKLLLGEEGAEGSICDAMEFLLTAAN